MNNKTLVKNVLLGKARISTLKKTKPEPLFLFQSITTVQHSPVCEALWASYDMKGGEMFNITSQQFMKIIKDYNNSFVFRSFRNFNKPEELQDYDVWGIKGGAGCYKGEREHNLVTTPTLGAIVWTEAGWKSGRAENYESIRFTELETYTEYQIPDAVFQCVTKLRGVPIAESLYILDNGVYKQISDEDFKGIIDRSESSLVNKVPVYSASKDFKEVDDITTWSSFDGCYNHVLDTVEITPTQIFGVTIQSEIDFLTLNIK